MQSESLYRELITKQIPLLDVRAPVEFNQGHIPGAINIPLLNDAQRHEVGIVYKNHGQEAAIKRGEALISGDKKASRLAKWKHFLSQHPDAHILCFRGGLRSRTSQQWLVDEGVHHALVPGGYKKMRQFLMTTFDTLITSQSICVISGRTGSGKTQLLQHLHRHIDLEKIAHHRGSSFGKHLEPQPAQAVFENRLMARLLQLNHASIAPIFIEDESNNVGSCHVPPAMRPMRKKWPLVVIEDPLEVRIARTREEYIDQALKAYVKRFGSSAEPRLAATLLDSLARIQKRLGGKLYRHLKELMSDAINHDHDRALHELWIRELLREYYDPMYDYQLERKRDQVIRTGSRQEILQWCQQHAELL